MLDSFLCAATNAKLASAAYTAENYITSSALLKNCVVDNVEKQAKLLQS